MKIEQGKRYECLNGFYMDADSPINPGKRIFTKGLIYLSDEDRRLINDEGESHGISEVLAEGYFRHYVSESETRPSHYGGDTNPHEPIKIIQHYGLSFELGNVIKYVLRSDKKGQREADLKKAMQYLQFELNKVNK